MRELKPEITQVVLEIDEILYNAGVSFAKEIDEENPNITFYAATMGNKFRFGFLGWNSIENKVSYIAEYTELTERNIKEGIPEDEALCLFELKSKQDFIKWLKNEYPQILSRTKKEIID